MQPITVKRSVVDAPAGEAGAPPRCGLAGAAPRCGLAGAAPRCGAALCAASPAAADTAHTLVNSHRAQMHFERMMGPTNDALREMRYFWPGSAPSVGAPVPDDPMNSVRPSWNVRLRPFALSVLSFA